MSLSPDRLLHRSSTPPLVVVIQRSPPHSSSSAIRRQRSHSLPPRSYSFLGNATLVLLDRAFELVDRISGQTPPRRRSLWRELFDSSYRTPPRPPTNPLVDSVVQCSVGEHKETGQYMNKNTQVGKPPTPKSSNITGLATRVVTRSQSASPLNITFHASPPPTSPTASIMSTTQTPSAPSAEEIKQQEIEATAKILSEGGGSGTGGDSSGTQLPPSGRTSASSSTESLGAIPSTGGGQVTTLAPKQSVTSSGHQPIGNATHAAFTAPYSFGSVPAFPQQQ